MAMPPFSSQSTGQPGKGVRTDVGRDHGNINVVASRTRWSLEARGSEVASGAAAASGALETETAAVAGRRRTYSGGLGGMGTRPLEGGGPGTCEAAAPRAYWIESLQGRVGESDDRRVPIFSSRE